MIKDIIRSVRTLILFIAIAFSSTAGAQYYYANDKDNTRPEVERLFKVPPRINTFTVLRNNGFNEIQWSATPTMDGNRFTAEFSRDGIIYEAAGEGIFTNGIYTVKHYNFEVNPLLYRIRSQGTDGKFLYSDNILIDGINVSPVTVFPTTVSTNTVNLRSVFPVERVSIFATGGQQVHTEDIGGRRDQIVVNIPRLSSGMYVVNVTGRGWKSVAKFIVP